jgi:hypothetical protein
VRFALLRLAASHHHRHVNDLSLPFPQTNQRQTRLRSHSRARRSGARTRTRWRACLPFLLPSFGIPTGLFSPKHALRFRTSPNVALPTSGCSHSSSLEYSPPHLPSLQLSPSSFLPLAVNTPLVALHPRYLYKLLRPRLDYFPSQSRHHDRCDRRDQEEPLPASDPSAAHIDRCPGERRGWTVNGRLELGCNGHALGLDDRLHGRRELPPGERNAAEQVSLNQRSSDRELYYTESRLTLDLGIQSIWSVSGGRDNRGTGCDRCRSLVGPGDLRRLCFSSERRGLSRNKVIHRHVYLCRSNHPARYVHRLLEALLQPKGNRSLISFKLTFSRRP